VVTLENGEDCQVQEFVGLGADRSPSTKCDPEPTTSSGLDLAHYDTVDDLAQKRDLALLDPQGSVKDRLLDGPPVVDLDKDTLLNGFPDGRDADHDRRSELAEIALAIPHGRVGQCLDPTIPKCYANGQKGEFDNVFHDVCEGQECEEGVIGFDLVPEEFVHSPKDGHEVGMSDDDSFGVSSRATGVHDAVYVIWLRRTRLCFFLRNGDAFSTFSKLLDGENGDIWANGLDLLEVFRLGFAVVDHQLDGGGVGDDICEDGEKVGVGENSHAFWFV